MIQIQFNQETLAELIKNAINEAFSETTNEIPKSRNGNCQTLHSIRELAEFLHCSTVSAQHYKNKGWIPFKQVGRKVFFNTGEVLEAIEKRGKRVRK